MIQSFDDASRVERISETEHRILIPDGWQQGRGAFGGLVIGAMMNCMAAVEPDSTRRARAFTGDLCGPALPLESRVTTRVLRRGNRQTNISATLEQEGGVVAHATCVLASPRKAVPLARISMAPPKQTPHADCAVLPFIPPVAPVFAQHYEYRIAGPLPFSQSKEAIVLGWVRERAPLAKLTAGALLGRLDAFYPALFSIEGAPRPIATVSYVAELLCDPTEVDPNLPLYYRAHIAAEADGYFVEMRELWHGDTVVALNQQTFAILG